MPKKHKLLASGVPRWPHVPGLDAMERLFSGLRGILFCAKDAEGSYLCANEAFLRRVRIESGEQLAGRSARELFPALLAAGYEQQDLVVVRKGRELHDRLEMITNADGSLGWYLTDKVPIRDASGKVLAIACISRDLRIPAADDPEVGELAKAIRRMRRDYAQPLRIAELARESGMSLSKFERLMRSILHIAPRQFLTQLRVEAATQRLRETETSLGEIALDCGFYDQATFCRQFKAITGLTASQFRKLSRKG